MEFTLQVIKKIPLLFKESLSRTLSGGAKGGVVCYFENFKLKRQTYLRARKNNFPADCADLHG